jgi:mono/diheme cytochrome c family protein
MNEMRKGWTRILALFLMLGSWGLAHAEYDAAGVYQSRCASCHGANGEGTKSPPLAPALKNNALILNAPADVIAQVIRKGRSGRERAYNDAFPNMPAFSPISVTDVDALIGYLKGDLQN